MEAENSIRVYDVLNVTESYINRHTASDGSYIFYLHVVNVFFKTVYHNDIPLDITNQLFEDIRRSKYKHCMRKRDTPELYEVRKQALKWCREHLFNKN